MQRSVLILRRAAMIALVILAATGVSLPAQTQTVGLIQYDTGSFAGYTLFAPISSTSAFLIDNYGRLVHSWETTHRPALSVYLLDNGDLLRTMKLSDSGGGFQKIAWDGTVIWEYQYYSADYVQHHDIEPLPNGNVLVLAREYKTAAEAFAAGRNPALLNKDVLYMEHIVEVEQTGPTTGNIVWEWHVWDHLIQDYNSSQANYGVVEDHPELFDINFVTHYRSDWLHCNSIAYNPDLDQIVIGSRTVSELYVIDHSTTTAEAAGHSGGNSGKGGDILYRWGNAQAYRQGTADDRKLFGPHDVRWIESGLPCEGNILIFNNGVGRPEGDYSSVDEIVPPVDGGGNYLLLPDSPYGPQELIWTYQAENPNDLYAMNISGAHRLPNGNTLICDGPHGTFFEVTTEGEYLWEYISPVTLGGMLEQGEEPGANSVFRCYRYAPDFPGLAGHELIPDGTLEIYPISFSGTSHSPFTPTTLDSVAVTATITSDAEITIAELHADTGDGFFTMTLFDDGIHHDGQAGDDLYGVVLPPMPELTTVSYYLHAVDGSSSSTSDPPIAPATTYSYIVEFDSFVCGDPNASGEVDIDDAVYLIGYIFSDGPAPIPLQAGDPDCSGSADIDDAVYLINYIFTGGNPPCDTDGDEVPDC